MADQVGTDVVTGDDRGLLGDAPAATSRPLAISISFSADTLGMDSLPFRTAAEATAASVDWPERRNGRTLR